MSKKSVETKVCRNCEQEKEISEFYVRSNGTVPYICASCERVAVIEREKARKGTFRYKCTVALKTARVSRKRAEEELGEPITDTLSLYDVLFTLGADDCVYCGRHCKQSEKTLEHIIPLLQGGTNTFDNIAMACTSCNSSKRDKPVTEFAQNHGIRAKNRVLERMVFGSGKEPEEVFGVLSAVSKRYEEVKGSDKTA